MVKWEKYEEIIEMRPNMFQKQDEKLENCDKNVMKWTNVHIYARRHFTKQYHDGQDRKHRAVNMKKRKKT